MLSPSEVAIVPWNGFGTPCRSPTASTSPIVRSTASAGSSSQAERQREVEQHLGVGLPWICGYSDGSIAKIRSRLILANSLR